MREVRQRSDLRSPIIKKLEALYKAKVVSFFTSFTEYGVQITDDDAEMLESVLAAEHNGESLFLIVNSPGGQALAAERIVNVCREYSGSRFTVVVPHMAKSAATMICFGADSIRMSKTAELGPVDPQVTYKDESGTPRGLSAEEYIRSYNKLITESTSGSAKRIEPYLQQLSRFDARYIEFLLSAQALSRDISVRLLKSGMMSTLPEKAIADKIDVFLSQEKTSSHGRMINHQGALGCGLKVELIDLYSNEWNLLWELYVRSDWAVSNTCKKLIESSSASISA